MKPVPLLVLALLLAACGSTVGGTGVPGSSGGESDPVGTYGPTTPVDESKLKPPQILLRTNVGEEQEAVAGSSCVDYVDPASGGEAACAAIRLPSTQTRSPSRCRVTK